MQYSRLLLAMLLLVLASCAGIDRQVDTPEADTTSFDAWQIDRHLQPAAVRQLVSQADQLIGRGQLADAEVVLNRTLRISNRIASVWSRLAWLSAEQRRHTHAQDYISKSNSLTGEVALLNFNWQLYYQSSLVLGDADGIALAKAKLETLQ